MLERLVTDIVNRLLKEQSFTGEVVSVDKEANTCEVDVDGLTKHDVRLTSVVDADEQKLLVYPMEGSQVTCSILENDPMQCYVSKYGVVEEVKVVIETTELVMNKDGYNIKRGGESLFKMITDLIAANELSTFSNGAGATGVPLNVADFTAVKDRVPNLLIE